MTGFALETSTSLEIIAAYASPKRTVQHSGWEVIGGFFLPKSTPARLEALGLVSRAGLTLNVRLYDLTAKTVVSGASLNITSTTLARVLSGIVSLTGQRNFQLQAQLASGSGELDFGLIETATITD